MSNPDYDYSWVREIGNCVIESATVKIGDLVYQEMTLNEISLYLPKESPSKKRKNDSPEEPSKERRIVE